MVHNVSKYGVICSISFCSTHIPVLKVNKAPKYEPVMNVAGRCSCSIKIYIILHY